MDILLRLAREGDMRSLLHQAAQLTELDERYLPFANQLRLLAQRFESKAILRFVEQSLGQEKEAGASQGFCRHIT
jgi:hypothetical protein